MPPTRDQFAASFPKFAAVMPAQYASALAVVSPRFDSTLMGGDLPGTDYTDAIGNAVAHFLVIRGFGTNPAGDQAIIDANDVVLKERQHDKTQRHPDLVMAQAKMPWNRTTFGQMVLYYKSKYGKGGVVV